MRKVLNAYIVISSIILSLADHKLIIYFIAIYGYFLLFRRFNFWPFVIGFILLEETVVYMLGGGLHGQAHSLAHDWIRSVPIFITHFYLWSRYASTSSCSRDLIVLLAGLHGVFREVIVPMAFSIGSIFIAAIAIFIYGYPLGLIEPGGEDCRPAVPWCYILLAEIIIGITLAIAFP